MSTNQNDNLPKKSDGPIVLKVSAGYSDAYAIRALIQSVPYVGGALDTLLAGPGANWRQKRLQEFLELLGDKLQALEGVASAGVSIPQSEEMHAFFVDTIDRVLRSRSDQKRRKFSLIAAKQIVAPADWDDADNASRLLDRITDFHLAVLTAIAAAPIRGEPFEGLRVVTLSPVEEEFAHLANLPAMFPNAEPRNLRLACAELIASGLLSDEGSGRYGTEAFEYFTVSDVGTWFLSWLDETSVDAHGSNSQP